MDSLSWKKLIPSIQVLPTQKLYFNQFLYRLELEAYASQCVNATTDVESAIAYRRNTYRNINFAGSWERRMNRQLDRADTAWLTYLKTFKENPPFEFKFRAEEPRVQIYVNDIDSLYKWVAKLPKYYKAYVKGITMPRNLEEETAIRSGLHIVKKTPEYRYKVFFRDGKYDLDNKRSILNYLIGLGDVVKVPTHCREELTKGYSTVWDAYIYTNDASITTFLQIINPRLIRRIIETTAIADINTVIIKES